MRRGWKPRKEDEYLVSAFLDLLERLGPNERQKLEYIIRNWFR